MRHLPITALALAAAALLAGPSCSRRPGSGAPKETTQQTQAAPADGEATNNDTTTMNVQEMTAEMFRQRVMDYVESPNEWRFKGERPVLIDFYATWCGPCKMMSPIVEEMAQKYAGRLDVYKVDIDQEQELAAVFGVQSIPTFLFIPADGQPQRAVGAMSRSEFGQAVATVLHP